MKLQPAIDMERLTPDLDMADVERHALEVVRMAGAGGSRSRGPAEGRPATNTRDERP